MGIQKYPAFNQLKFTLVKILASNQKFAGMQRYDPNEKKSLSQT